MIALVACARTGAAECRKVMFGLARLKPVSLRALSPRRGWRRGVGGRDGPVAPRGVNAGQDKSLAGGRRVLRRASILFREMTLKNSVHRVHGGRIRADACEAPQFLYPWMSRNLTSRDLEST